MSTSRKPAQGDLPEDRTEQLDLHIPQTSDLQDLHRLYSDPRVWSHLPSGRFADIETTEEVLSGWISAWESGLGTWVARENGTTVGHGGCALRQNTFWNLGYRFAPEAQGRGFATELSLRAIERARKLRPDLPIVAYLLEHNEASAAVARKVGLTLQHRGPDAGNPDPTAIRLVFADRTLDSTELAATMR
ncbi:GNAT family N-acetyltransferase [Rothia uropygioeca]|uniref:GNAT family N-acetyltransferase n=1 Tax=Kocuria sp. 257 TaxID=2021970 RepID=UPI001EDF21A0|nr:GNAT family N-acetyltransferase [Kocuria sp. 257]